MNDKMDIPDGELIPIEDTDLDVEELPGDWEWSSANHYHWNHKVNVFFGRDVAETGGQYGEIDNYPVDDGEMWTLHVRPIVDVPGEDRNRPRGEAETIEEHESLAEAIDAVPDHIATYYGGDAR